MDINVNKELNIGVIGCGKMANAILGGIYSSKMISSKQVFIYDKNSEAAVSMKNKFDFNISKSINEVLNNSQILLIATKPFVINSVLEEINSSYKNQLVLSILAGVKIKKYESYIKNIKLVRIMPNTPALVNEGASALCPNKNVSNKELEIARKIMSSCGKVIISDESKIDIITALSGSGPAFYYKIIQLFANSAIKLGLDKHDAYLLSTQTAYGSAKMLFENNYDFNQLITNVTTPGGCTEAGNKILNESNIDKILDDTIEKTVKKAIDIG